MRIFDLDITKQNIKYLLYPILIFMGTFLVSPLYSLEANVPTIPYFQWSFVIVTTLFFTSKKLNSSNNNFIIVNLIIIFLFYAIFISKVNIASKISFVGVVLFAKLFSDIRNTNNYFNKIYSFILSYLILSISIYVVRMIMYNFDLYRVRGGMNIWGGNSLIMAVYLFMIIQILFKRPKNEIFIFSLIALVLSLMFVTRIAIVTSVILMLIQLFQKLKKNFFKVVISLVVLWSLFWKTFINSTLFKTIGHRFSTFNLQETNDASAIVKATSSGRAILWELVGRVLEENPMGIGVGSFRFFSNYSSPHNLLLNNLVESGIFFGFILNVILFLPLFKFIRINMSFKERLLLMFIYSSFLLNASISGAKLIQTSGYTTSFILLLLFSVFNSVKYKINPETP